MKIEKIYEFYHSYEKAFRCPLCHTTMRAKKPASLVCKKGHCYDISKYGYVNFLPHQKPTKYQKELFDSRRAVFERGYYEPLGESIYNIIEEYRGGTEQLNLTDAGCGEGYYAGYLKERLTNSELYVFDNAKEAVKMCSEVCKELCRFVGDITNIPVKAKSMDFLLNIFTPSNYGEACRILKDDGYLLKVIPGEEYLKELRACIGEEQIKNEYSQEPVVNYFCSHMNLEKQLRVSYVREVDKEAADHFLRMTPLMFDRDFSSVNVDGLSRLTFDFIILLGGKSKDSCVF